MKLLEGFPAERSDRHATALLHDEANVRIVAFTLGAGQEVAMHSSPSTVAVHVVAGSGVFRGSTDATLTAGASAVYAPDEPHGMQAGPDGLRFLAVIAPAPRARG